MSRQKTGGREPGSFNKMTRNVKEALESAFEELGAVPALVKWGKSNPCDFYRLWGCMLPKEVKAENIEKPVRRVVFVCPDNGRGSKTRSGIT